MNVPFKVFPSNGYKNSQFQAISSIDNLSIQIEYEGRKVVTVTSSSGQPATFLKLNEPGTYRASATHNGHIHEQYFQVIDGVRIGTSELHKVFVFDAIPYVFILMRDRMLIFQEDTHSLLEENIRPTSITKLDASHLLFQTEIGNDPESKLLITNIGIYSLDSLSIKAELLDHYSLIWLDTARQRIWLYHLTRQRIVCLSAQEQDIAPWPELFSVSANPVFKLQEGKQLLFAQTDDTITVIDTYTLDSTSVAKSESLALDDVGFCYSLSGRNVLRSDGIGEVPTELIGSIPDTASLDAKGFYFTGKNFRLNPSASTFNTRTAAVSAANPIEVGKTFSTITLTTPDIGTSEPSICTLYPSTHGGLILQTNETLTISAIRYQQDANKKIAATALHSIAKSYELFSCHKGDWKSLLTDTAPITAFYYRQGTIVARDSKNSVLIQGSEASVLERPTSDFDFISTDTNQHYFVARFEHTVDLFKLGKPLTKVLKQVSAIDKKQLVVNNILWYRSEDEQIVGYNLRTTSVSPFSLSSGHQWLLKTARAFKFNQGYVLADNKALITADGKVKATIPGDIVAFSTSLNKIVCRRDQELYVLNYQSNGLNYTSATIPFPLLNYQESYLSPDGKFLVLKDKTHKYLLYNIATGETSTYLSGKFLAFDKSGSLIFEGDKSRSAKLLDPVTFEDITPLSYHHYRFHSPDGLLFAQTVPKPVRFYGRVVARYLTTAEVQHYRSNLDYKNGYAPQDKKEKEDIQQKRLNYFTKHKAFFLSQGIEDSSDITSDNVIEVHQRLEIGVIGTSIVAEVSLPAEMSYFNYAAFSDDSKYIGLVGKSPGCGFITLAKLNYQKSSGILSVEQVMESNYPSKATWVCGISKTGYFATYDSDGYTYVLSLNADYTSAKRTHREIEAGFSRPAYSVYSQSDNWLRISDKNFLCFSPSGLFMALSEQTYDPITCGGTGHQASNAVHVITTEEGRLIDSFRGHGGMVKHDLGNKLVFAAFSEDECSLMTMANDGVVIIRNIADKLHA
jgi:hypothetical protein